MKLKKMISLGLVMSVLIAIVPISKVKAEQRIINNNVGSGYYNSANDESIDQMCESYLAIAIASVIVDVDDDMRIRMNEEYKECLRNMMVNNVFDEFFMESEICYASNRGSVYAYKLLFDLANKGNLIANEYIGNIYLKNRNARKAIEYYMYSATRGLISSKNKIAKFIFDGAYGLNKDENGAINIFAENAASGDFESIEILYNLGEFNSYALFKLADAFSNSQPERAVYLYLYLLRERSYDQSVVINRIRLLPLSVGNQAIEEEMRKDHNEEYLNILRSIFSL